MTQHAALNPEASVEELASLVARFPREVLSNPALPLLLLAYPEHVAQMIRQARAGLVGITLQERGAFPEVAPCMEAGEAWGEEWTRNGHLDGSRGHWDLSPDGWSPRKAALEWKRGQMEQGFVKTLSLSGRLLRRVTYLSPRLILSHET